MIKSIIAGVRTPNPRNLIEDINNIGNIYSYRNRFYLGDLDARIKWLDLGAKDLFEVMRKSKPRIFQELVVARVFARIVAVDEYFRTHTRFLPFVRTLCAKYPMTGCSYCKGIFCTCLADREGSSELDMTAFALQKKWSINDWQEHLAKVYGQVNSTKGWEYIHSHFVSEITEIRVINEKTKELKQSQLIHEYSTELADAFSWLCGFATHMNVSLGDSVEMVYGHGCSACGYAECDCGPHHFDFLNFKALEKQYHEALKEQSLLMTANTVSVED